MSAIRRSLQAKIIIWSFVPALLILLVVAGGAGWGIKRLAATAPFWPGLAILMIWGATGLAARSQVSSVALNPAA